MPGDRLVEKLAGAPGGRQAASPLAALVAASDGRPAVTTDAKMAAAPGERRAAGLVVVLVPVQVAAG